MTKQIEPLSYIEKISENPFHSREIAAAELMEEAAEKLQEALKASSHTLETMAQELSVSVERIREVVSGEADILVSTLARYLKTLNQEIEFSFKKLYNASDDLPEIEVYAEADGLKMKYTLEHPLPDAHEVGRTFLGRLAPTSAQMSIISDFRATERRRESRTELNGKF